MGRKKKYLTEEERKAAKRERMKRWREKNPDKVKESNKRWRDANPEYQKQYYQENTDKVKEYQKKYYQENADYIKDYRKHYYQENAEKEKEMAKQWREDNPEYQKQWREENPDYLNIYRNTPIGRAGCLLSAYQQKDKKYNRGECTLTVQWIMDNIFNKPCHYCGKEGWNVIGCDRIDNDLPHTPDNVVPCCYECNTKRGTKSYEEFLMTIPCK